MSVISATDVRRAAMDLLARREHGAVELQDKLLRRFNKVLRAKKAARVDGFPAYHSETDQGFQQGFQQGLQQGLHQGVDQEFDQKNPELADEAMSKESLVALIEQEVSKLTGSGLQDDLRLAEAFVRSRANRGQGPMKVKMELRQKGVSDSLVEQAMNESGVDWQAVAVDVATRKFSRDFNPSDPKQRARRQRFLQQRGFSFEQISAVERQ